MLKYNVYTENPCRVITETVCVVLYRLDCLKS